MARLMREEELGACQLELANGRVLRLAQLRCVLGWAARCRADAMHWKIEGVLRTLWPQSWFM